MAKKKEINWNLVELYVKSGCSQSQIAESLFICRDTLRDRVKEQYGMEYSAFSSALHSEGDILILAQQFQKAMKGYWPALQWLGKIRLNQREPELVNSTPPAQDQIDKDHLIMQLQHQNSELSKKLEQMQDRGNGN